MVNVAETVKRDRALGVNNPNTPVWTRERIEPSVEEAAAAGQKIQHAVACKSRLATLWAIPPCAVNGVAQTAIEGVKTPQLESTPIRVQAHRASNPDGRGKGTQRGIR